MKENGRMKLLIIAGGDFQVPIIKKAKSMGVDVVNSNLYEDSIGFQYSDWSEVADVRDKEKNLQFAKKHNVDGVLTDQSDIAVPTVAYVATELGLPTIGNDLAKLFTNKYCMRDFCRDHGLPYPEYACCSSAEEVRQFKRSLGKKIIIKPLDSQASRGVHVITNEENIDAQYEDACRFSADGKSVIAERFINGTEFTVDGLVTPEGHRSLCISEKKHYTHNESIACELFFSHDNDRFDYAKLRQTNDTFVNLAKLPFGLTHAEYKYEDGQFYLIEIAARGGGTKISSDIFPLLTGIDNYAYLVDSALGKKFDGNLHVSDEHLQRCAVLKFLNIDTHGAPVQAIEGFDEIASWNKIIDFQLSFKPGEPVGLPNDDKSRCGYYIAYEETRENLLALMEKVEKTLTVRY